MNIKERNKKSKFCNQWRAVYWRMHDLLEFNNLIKSQAMIKIKRIIPLFTKYAKINIPKEHKSIRQKQIYLINLWKSGKCEYLQLSNPYSKKKKHRYKNIIITKANYSRVYLKLKWWRKRRKAYWASHPDSVCFCCGEKPELLHHSTYKHLFKEKDEDLIPLCKNCHIEVHDLIYTDYTKTINYSNAHIYYKRLKKINDELYLPKF